MCRFGQNFIHSVQISIYGVFGKHFIKYLWSHTAHTYSYGRPFVYRTFLNTPRVNNVFCPPA